MKVAIVGATSFIGTNLIKTLKNTQIDIVAVVRKSSDKRKQLEKMASNKMEIRELNLDNYDRLGETIGRVDCLVYLTWNGTRGKTRSDFALQKYNYQMGMRAISSVIKTGCSKIITAGSQAEYGPWFEDRKLTENDFSAPNTEYGKFKLKFFTDVQKMAKSENVSVIEPRFFSLYGPDDYKGTMIISILENMLKNDECNLTQCIQTWDFLYISDAIDGLVKMIESKVEPGVYNFGSGISHPLKYYIEQMYSITKSKSKLNYGAIPYPETGIVNVNPDISKLKRIGWMPKVTFCEGIEKILQSMRISNVSA